MLEKIILRNLPILKDKVRINAFPRFNNWLLILEEIFSKAAHRSDIPLQIVQSGDCPGGGGKHIHQEVIYLLIWK